MNISDDARGSRMERSRKDVLLDQMRGISKAKVRSARGSVVNRPIPRFEDMPEYKQVQIQKMAGDLASIGNPFYRMHDVGAGATTVISGRTLTNFASYDYLGTNRHPYVHQKVTEALSNFGLSASASRLVAGERPVHRELEARLAGLYGADAAVALVSGYLTNVTVIGGLMGQDDLVLHDELIHNSILAGIRLSGAARRFFRHNDMTHLEELLASFEGRFRRILVIAEGIYSMDGDVVDLPALVDLRERYGFWLMIDEAHALGVLGTTGRGTYEHFGVDPRRIDIWAGTLSKTTSSCGGYVAGSDALVTVLKGTAGGFIYSVGLAPPLAAGAIASLEIVGREPARIDRLRANGALFLKLANAAGLDTGLSLGFSVVPVIVGDSVRAARLSNDLLTAGINVLPIIHPAVPEGQARLRFFITSEHTKEQIEAAVALTADCLQKLVAQNFGIASLDRSQIEQFMATL